MLVHRSCHDCGRRVRLSTTIEPPRCPACRLASLPPLVETRTCLGCRVPIPALSYNLRCALCQTRPSSQPLLLDVRPCYDCGTPFHARTGVIRCFDCRSRRSTVVQAPVDYGHLRTTTFDPFVNSFQRLHDAGESVLERGSHLRPLAPVPQPQLTLPQSFDLPNTDHHPAPPPLDPRTEPRTQRFVLPAGPLPVPVLQQSLLSQPTLLAVEKRRNSTLLRPAVKKQRTIDSRTFQDNLNRALCFLGDELETRAVASDAFPPEISSSHIRASVARYEDFISAAAKRSVCCSCGKFVPNPNVHQVDNEDPLLLPLKGLLDTCGRHNNIWDVCSSCHTSLNRHMIPKFSAKNMVNVTLCQDYPSTLEGLTLTEECLIAKCHPLGVVLKLRPGGHPSPVNYHALRGHFIVIPQDPGPLLNILPSPELTLHSLIKVFWLGARPPKDSDLSPFLLVRKAKVLAALQYLVQYNHLYRDLTINQPMIDDWSDDFIPLELRDSIICLDEPDHHEREGYTVDLRTGNYENDLQAAQDSARDVHIGEPFITGSVSTDINGERQDPNLRVLDALFSVITNRLPTLTEGTCHRKMPVISYKIHGQATLVDHWSDPHYFTAAFPTLFPVGIGGHLDERTIPVSLGAYAEWALSHHSRRCLHSVNEGTSILIRVGSHAIKPSCTCYMM